MSPAREASGDIREREPRDARFFSWAMPGDAHIVALVYEPGDAERSATVVDAIATSVARRREHTLLLSTEPGPSPLDELLGGADSEGLPAALGGRARLTDVAVQRGDRPFVYLPAGQDPAAMGHLLENQMLSSFIDRVRERGGTLFLAISERTLGSAAVRAMLDGYVALGDAQVPVSAAALKAFGRVRFEDAEEVVLAEVAANGDGRRGGESVAADTSGGVTEREVEVDPVVESEAAETAAGRDEPETRQRSRGTAAADLDALGDAEPDEGSGDPEGGVATEAWGDPAPAPGAWSRHRAESGVPIGPVAGGAVAVLLIAAGWWWLARTTQATPEPTDLARPAPAEVGPAPPTPLDPDAVRRAFEAAPGLPFSVQIASFAAREDAEERLARLRSGSGGAAGALFFIAPTPVRGVVYHRLFAGALPTRAEAASLLGDLVADGRAEDAGPWVLKNTPLAFDLGVFADRGEADERLTELASKGIPAYVLAAPSDADSAYQVYGGAYANEGASLPMADMLDEAGEPASLIARRGVTLAPSNP